MNLNLFKTNKKEVNTLLNGQIVVETHYDSETNECKRHRILIKSAVPNVFTDEDGYVEIRLTGNGRTIDVVNFGKFTQKIVSNSFNVYGYMPRYFMQYLENHWEEIDDKAKQETEGTNS